MVVEMSRPEHWEPPDPPKLLVSARRVAEELQVPIWKANEICWSLDCRFYARGQVHYRVMRRSLDALKRLLDQGLTLSSAREVMAHYRQRDDLPPDDMELGQASELAWRIRYRRRHGLYR